MAFKNDIKTALSNLSASKKTRLDTAFTNFYAEENLTVDEKLNTIADWMINELVNRVKKSELEATLSEIEESDFSI